MTAVVLADALVARTRLAPAAIPAWPARALRESALVVGSAALLAVLAQVVVPLPFTPVPLTLSTFGVILLGAALGPRRGVAAVALYVAAGMLGAPVFAGAGAGFAFASFGYIAGYLPAAALVGWGARRGTDRSVGGMLAAAAGASLIIYAAGIAWLMAWMGIGLGAALAVGMVPFLLGDAIKIAAVALLLPAAWRAIEKI